MLSRRIIPCLDVRDGVVVKGVRFKDHVVIGDILDLAWYYRDAGADELVFYDITASAQGRSVDTIWIEKIAKKLDIPFCVAGGIRSIADARRLFHAGADKISINSPALERPELINELAETFGSQAVVVGVDSLWREDEYRIWQYTGSVATARETEMRTKEWIIEAQARGAGEIVLNCMNADGTRRGYDIEQLAAIREICEVPLVASGGAGKIEDFSQVFHQTKVDGALAAGVFHRKGITISDLKAYLAEQGVAIRI